MKVLVVTTSYPRFAGDAAGCFVETRVQQLRAQGAEVEIIAADGPGVVGRQDVQGQGQGRGDVRRVGSGVSHPVLFYAGGAPEALDRSPLRALIEGFGFLGHLLPALAARLPFADQVESHWLVPCAVAVAVLGPRVPHRAHAHSGDVALLERLPAGDAVARWLSRTRPQLIFASADLQARFARLLGPSSSVVPSQVDPADSALVRAPARRSAPAQAAAFAAAHGVRTPVVLGVGRLVPIKGYDRLIRAVGRLPVLDRPAVVLLGDGPERLRLAEMARARSVELHLPGQVAPSQVGAWLASAAVFAHPARRLADGRSEGTPVAVREAVAAGIPVVAVATGGLADLAAGGVSVGSARFTLLQDEEGSAGADALARALAEALLQAPPDMP